MNSPPRSSSFLAIACSCFVAAARCPAGDAQQEPDSAADHPRSSVDTAALQRNWDALRQRGLRLLPVPKQLQFRGEPLPLSGEGARRAVVVLAEDSPRGRIAANEIVSRLEDFSAKVELPVVAAPQAGAYNVVIENRWPNTTTVLSSGQVSDRPETLDRKVSKGSGDLSV
ncbi:MAG: hypothetical protein COY42_10890, partial [Armatimonadetes bacterium CG_4_10_14_0_8_um_filter_66_14]